METTDQASLIRLDDTNYPTWLYLMQHHLRGHGLLKFVDGSYPCPSQLNFKDDGIVCSDDPRLYERWLKQDSSAICMIINTLSVDALTLVIGCETSLKVWSTLKQHYAPESDFHIMRLKSTLHNIRKGSDSIDKYLLRFKDVQNQLVVVGNKMSDDDMKTLILAGLPIEYGPTRQIIRGEKDIGMEEMRSLLLSAEYEIELKHKASSLSHYVNMIARNGMFSSDNHNGMMPSGNAYSTEMQQNGLGVFAVPYNCSVVPLLDAHYSNAYSGSSSLSAYNVSSSNAISQIGYVTTMATNPGFINTYTSSASSSFLPSHVSQRNSAFAQPAGLTSQNGGRIQNGGGLQVPYGGAISQLHNGCQSQRSCLTQQNADHSQGFGHQTANVCFSSSGYQGISSQNYTEDNNNSYHNNNNNIRNILKPRNSQQQQDKSSSLVVCQICDNPGHSAYNCHHRNFQPQDTTSSSSSKRQISQKPGQSAMNFYCNKRQENQLTASSFTPKALSATICTQLKPPSIATQPNKKAFQSQVKPLPFAPAYLLSVDHPHLQQAFLKEIEALSTTDTWAFSSTVDNNLLNCRQAAESSSLWRSLPLIPPG